MNPPNLDEELPPMTHPAFNTKVRGSNILNEQPVETMNNQNGATPPPPTAKQVAPHHAAHFYDAAMLHPTPRQIRSTSVGGDYNKEFMINPDRIPPPMDDMQKASSLPVDKYNNPKIPPLPGQEQRVKTIQNDTESGTAQRAQYYFKQTPKDLGKKPRHRTQSEPLLPQNIMPKYDMISDSIWRTNPNQEPIKSGSNEEESQNDHIKTPSKTKSDPFSSQKRLTTIPDHTTTLAGTYSKDSMISPNAINIDNIITPQAMISPPSINDLNSDKNPNSADWDYFGFNTEELKNVTSPIPENAISKKPQQNDINPLPPTPPFQSQPDPKKEIKSIDKDEEIRKLKLNLVAAMKQIEQLTLSQIPPTPKFSEKDSSKKPDSKQNDDEKDNMPSDDMKNGINTMEENETEKLTDIQRRKLERYQHFITCPSCNTFDPKTPRNQVLIPCGHLVCRKCSNQTQEKQKCPICDGHIENYQLLLIE